MGAVLMANKDEEAEARKRRGTKLKRLGQHQLSTQQWSDVCRGMKMSLREQRVCKLLFDGLTRQKIAEQIGISNRTVRHHMEQIHVKLDVSNRVGVVLRIIQLRDLLSSKPLISSQVKPSPHQETLVQAEPDQPPEA